MGLLGLFGKTPMTEAPVSNPTSIVNTPVAAPPVPIEAVVPSAPPPVVPAPAPVVAPPVLPPAPVVATIPQTVAQVAGEVASVATDLQNVAGAIHGPYEDAIIAGLVLLTKIIDGQPKDVQADMWRTYWQDVKDFRQGAADAGNAIVAFFKGLGK